MFAIPKHRKCVSVLVTGAEVCVASVVWVTQMGQGEGEDLVHLGERNRQTKSMFRLLLQVARVGFVTFDS